MIKMKKLIRSLVVALGGVFIGATASDAAGIGFFTNGLIEDYHGQFSDIEIAPGQLIPFFIHAETPVTLPNPSINDLVVINYSVIIDDPAEIEFSSNPQNPALSNLGNPTLSNLGNPTLDFIFGFALNYNRNEHSPSFWIKTLDGLRNDGMSDLSFRLNSAYFVNNSGGIQDITNLFGGAGVQGTLDFQAPGSPSQNTPEPGTMLSAAVALGWGAWLKRKNASQ
jgi:hypothetical protein